MKENKSMYRITDIVWKHHQPVHASETLTYQQTYTAEAKSFVQMSLWAAELNSRN